MMKHNKHIGRIKCSYLTIGKLVVDRQGLRDRDRYDSTWYGIRRLFSFQQKDAPYTYLVESLGQPLSREDLAVVSGVRSRDDVETLGDKRVVPVRLTKEAVELIETLTVDSRYDYSELYQAIENNEPLYVFESACAWETVQASEPATTAKKLSIPLLLLLLWQLS